MDVKWIVNNEEDVGKSIIVKNGNSVELKDIISGLLSNEDYSSEVLTGVLVKLLIPIDGIITSMEDDKTHVYIPTEKYRQHPRSNPRQPRTNGEIK